jgi:hypothetical protein
MRSSYWFTKERSYNPLEEEDFICKVNYLPGLGKQCKCDCWLNGISPHVRKVSKAALCLFEVLL